MKPCIESGSCKHGDCYNVACINYRTERNNAPAKWEDEINRLKSEVAELKKLIADAPEVKLTQFADGWSLGSPETSFIFGGGSYKGMQPGETRKYKLVEVKE